MTTKFVNFTQVPNLILDHMSDFTPTEFMVASFVARKTMGWHKDRDVLSLSQIEAGTGLSRKTVLKGLEQLIAEGWLERVPAGDSFSYALRVCDSYVESGGEFPPELVENLHTQNKGKKEYVAGQNPPATEPSPAGFPVGVVQWDPATFSALDEDAPTLEPQYVEEGDEFGDGGPRARPKWQLPPDDPFLKRAMALSGAKFFSNHDQRTAWKAVSQARTAGLMSDRWLEHCLEVVAQRQQEAKRRLPLKSILVYMGNLEKMRQWENVQADSLPSAKGGGKQVNLGMYTIDYGPSKK